jgi:hypothetical protein
VKGLLFDALRYQKRAIRPVRLVSLLPADAPRPKAVGGKLTRGCSQAAGGLCWLRGGQQGDGPRPPVVLDQQFAVGRAFEASGTPSAVFVDAEGKVASEVAVGASAVMELAGADRTT